MTPTATEATRSGGDRPAAPVLAEMNAVTPPRTPPRRRRVPWAAWFAGASVTAAAAAAVVLLSATPPSYAHRAAPADQSEQRALSKEFLKVGLQFTNDIRHEPVWAADFQERQINAWLADDFEANHAEQTLPAGVSRPRLAMDGDILKVGFRYRRWWLSTVVQIGLRCWVPKRNVLAVELQGATAGALPLPTSQTRRFVETLAEANNLEVTWRRNGHNLVALLEFPRDYREIVLQRVEVTDGKIHFKGVRARASYSGGDFAPAAN